MIINNYNRATLRARMFPVILGLFCLIIFGNTHLAPAQEQSKSSDYLLGQEQRLEMVVHIWGEVKAPGEYRVNYDTDIIELISKAGGPTQYANLGDVRITRESESLYLTRDALKTLVNESRSGKITEDKLDQSLRAHFSNRIINYDVKKYLRDKKNINPPPVLKPGDVVTITTNSYFKWREFVRVAHEVAVIASIYVWYLRAQNYND